MKSKPQSLLRFSGLALVGVAALCALTPAQAATVSGPVFITISDNGNAGTDILMGSLNAVSGYTNPTNPGSITGFNPSDTIALQNEIPGPAGALGGADFHFEYLTSGSIAPGAVFSENFNIMGPGGELSDTLGITFTGHAPGAGDNNNISIDLHYRSDNESIAMIPLVNGVSISESNTYVDLTSLITSLAPGGTGLVDFNLRFSSADAPEPGTISMIGLGLSALGIVALRRRRRT